MADEIAVAKCVRLLIEAWPKEPMSEGRVQLYQNLLADIPDGALEAATLQCIASCKFFPTIAELRAESFELSPVIRGIPSAYDAWGEVTDAFLRTPSNGGPQWSYPLIGAAIDSIGGWYSLCMSENGAADRSRFIDAYNQLAVRETKQVTMLPQIADIVKALDVSGWKRLAAPIAEESKGG